MLRRLARRSGGSLRRAPGGVVSLIAKQVKAEPGRLPELLSDLLELVLAPYLGSAEAERLARGS